MKELYCYTKDFLDDVNFSINLEFKLLRFRIN